MSKGSAPPAPDYVGAAKATAEGNLQNLNQQTAANRPDQYTPWGSSTWTSTPGADGTTSWTNNIVLTPEEQQALNSQQKIQQNQSQLAQAMQGQVASQMANGFTAPSMSSYMNGVPSINSNFQGFSPSGVGSVDQSHINANGYTGQYQGINQSFNSSAGPLQTSAAGAQVNTDPNAFTSGAGSVNLNAPQFDQATADAGTQAAYKASTGLLTDQWAQDTKNLDSQLRIQGLTPGTEAYNNAMQNTLRVQGQQKDQLANQAVLTGNQLANTNYASALAGYSARNAAQGQAFNQGLSSFGAANTAIGQQFGQNLSNAQLNNSASAQQQGQDLNAFNANNMAATQSLQNGLSQYASALQGQSAYNSAAGQAYSQALGSYGVNQQAQLNSNAAQQQSYAQAMQQYQTAYQDAYQNYLQPLNSMNAVLTGQQVNMPQMPGFTAAGYTPGTDYSSAASSLGQYNSGVAAQNAANSSSTMGTIGSLAMAAAVAY
ncbi:hypothetical protein [Massilia suwonensis]|uniref:Uncharacterized protein n=1 Tax=Massilia suwonensis TaxID=648895 RepID=A0ABW0MHY5_9BURK